MIEIELIGSKLWNWSVLSFIYKISWCSWNPYDCNLKTSFPVDTSCGQLLSGKWYIPYKLLSSPFLGGVECEVYVWRLTQALPILRHRQKLCIQSRYPEESSVRDWVLQFLLCFGRDSDLLYFLLRWRWSLPCAIIHNPIACIRITSLTVRASATVGKN